MNKVILIGRLGQDPETRETKGGNVVSFSLATSKKRDGQDITEWHRISAWGKTGDNCARFLTKGSMVAIEGEIHTRSWEKNGEKRSSTEINAWTVEFLSPAGGARRQQAEASHGQQDEITF